MNVEFTNNSEHSTELVKIEKIPETPFDLVLHDEKWYVMLGKFRLTEGMTKEEAKEDAYRQDWERLMQIIGAMIQGNEEIKQLNHKN